MREREREIYSQEGPINVLCSGWFWECPNGGKNCKYRHALPKDYVLKKDRKRMEKEAQAISIEELIEKERANLDTSKLTKVTLETFVAWKKKKLKEKALAEKKEKSKKEKQGTVSGRDLFLKDPTMLARHVEEDDGEDFDLTREQEEDDGTKVMHFSFSKLMRMRYTKTKLCCVIMCPYKFW